MNKNSRGFSVVELLIIIAVIGIVGLIGWQVVSQNNTSQGQNLDQDSQELLWRQTANGWEVQGDAPTCPAQPLLQAPADLGKVTSVLYPGQTRGGDYKAHGGLRFDTTKDNNVTVKVPFDGYIVKATRNFAQGTTEVQYGFDIMSNCGIMTRFGHLRELPTSFQQITDKLPEPSADSRIENINPPVFVKQGEVIATKVGLISERNTFFDWGIYDYRQQNEASKSASYKSAHPQGELAWYAVCWLQGGWLKTADQAVLAALPAADPVSGKKSDYCK